MKDKNPIDLLLKQIGDILDGIQSYQGPIGEVSPQILEEVGRLEKAIALFEETNNKTFQEANIDINTLKNQTLQSHHTSPQKRQQLEKAQTLEKDAKRLQHALIQILAKRKLEDVKGSNTQQIRERRKRFKRVGGNKNWIPL